MLGDCNTFFSCLYNTLYNTLYVGAIFTTGFALSFGIVAVFVNNDNNYRKLKDSDNESESESDEEEEEDTRNPSEVYCDKYWDEYNDLEDKELDDEKLNAMKLNSVVDELPFYGSTLIKYDNDSGCYDYYNNRGSHVPYKMLATLARKYVTTFDCKNLYINLDDELEKSKKVLEEIQKRLNEETKNNEDSVFANVKKTKRLSTEKANEYLVKGNFIKFKYKGKVEESGVFNKTKADDEREIDTKSKKIDFETFKKMMNNKEKDE